MHLVHIIILFALVLGFLIFFHELGHFLMAKACGVRVERFSIGFPPRLFGFKCGDTDYCVSLLPFGGYVKMAGEMPGEEHRLDESIDMHGSDHPHDPAELNARPRWQRILIALAGPAANFLLSFILIACVAHFHYEVPAFLSGPAVVDYVPQNTGAARSGMTAGDTITQFSTDANPTWEQIENDTLLNLNHDVPFTYLHNGVSHTGTVHVVASGSDSVTTDPVDEAATGLIPREQTAPISVTEVMSDTPAERAGLKSGDQIEAVDNFQLHSVPALLAYLHDRNGAPLVLHIDRGGQQLALAAIPEKISFQGSPQFRLGFAYQPTPTAVKHLPIFRALHESITENLNVSTLVGRVVKGMFTRHVAVKSLSGPIGIAQQLDLAAQYGKWVLVNLVSTISLQLGLLNLLPIPLLDGGMILFLLIESALRRDLHQEIKERVYQAAFVCLVLFMGFIIFNDIIKLHLGRP